MALSILQQAKRKFAKKKYKEVISLLEPHILEYKDSFYFYLYLGLAYMNSGEISSALDYFEAAKKIRPNNPTLLSAQGVLFLRKGDTNKAISYYLKALTSDKNYKLAKKGLEFLRHNNTPEKIGDFIHSGKIKELYPDPTTKYKKNKVVIVTFMSFAIVLLSAFALSKFIKLEDFQKPKRKNISELILIASEKQSAVDDSGTCTLTLSQNEIIKTYDRAQKYFQKYRDNMAQYEVNRILLSNASKSIKQKAQLLSEYFEAPDFTNITDVFDYATVMENPTLYESCYVLWKGSANNVVTGVYNTIFDLLVGYENKTKLEGVVSVSCGFVVEIDTEKPIEVLGKIKISEGKVLLSGISIYQSGQPSKN